MLVKRLSLIALSVLCLMLVGMALANPTQNYEIVRYVFGGGGDHFAQGIYSLDNTIGKSVARNYKGADTELCVGFWCQSAFEAQIPNPDFTASPRQDDVPLAVTFTDTSTYTPTQWLWHFGDGETSATQHPTHTYEIAQPYTVTLVVTNAYGSDRLTRPNYITVTCPLTDVALSSRGLLKPDTTVTFTVEPLPDNTKPPYTYTIDYDDGTTPITSTASTDPIVITYTYDTTGTYTVEIGVWNCPEVTPVTATHTITVTTAGVCLPPTDVELSARGTMNPNRPITFTTDPKPNDTSMPYTYTIDYDDGTTPLTDTTDSDPAVVTHTYATTGTYTVEVGVWNCDMTTPLTDTHTVIITCTSVTGVDLSARGTMKPDNPITFTADLAPNDATMPYTYTIDYDDGRAAGTAPLMATTSADPLALSHIYATTGTYTVEIGVWNCVNAMPITATHTVTITAAEACTSVTGVDLSARGTMKPDNPITFTADLMPDDATTPYSYTIDYDDNTTPLTATASADPLSLMHTYDMSGTYTVEVGVWNCDMTTPVTATYGVTITAVEVCTPLISVDLNATSAMQTGDPVTFTVDLLPDDATTPYSYTIDYDDSTAPLTATASADPLSLMHTYDMSGTYTVEVGVWNCDMTTPVTATYGVTITAVEVCTPLTSVDLSATGAMQMGAPVTFTADLLPDDATTPYSYTIDYDDGTAPLTATASVDPLILTHTYSTTGTYTVEIDVWNCEMTTPITATLDVDIVTDDDFYIYIPLVLKNSG
jgi:PKD repeat protein